VDPDLLLLMAKNERLMPHLHLSVQSGDDMILRRMRRRHTRGQVIDLVRAVRALRPDVTLGTDLIAGFPTETEDMFENTRSLIDEADITFVHVFPYSPRPGTPAANMPAVSAVICKKRALLLREAGIVRREALLDRSLGERAHVLTETGDMGHTAHFIPMRLDKHVSAGTLVAATVTGHKDGILMGECL
ncbi:MAG: radical SAM protein, partial [Pseudomonadota bacterium]|nr:radical SAM protein [Pseudomonadota bacterium]